jgi:hypothetical protein
VSRDTPVSLSESAVTRGHLLKVLGLGCVTASVLLCLLLWRLASLMIN